LPLGVALSTAVHAAVVAWVATRAPPPRRTAAPADTTPIEIVTVDRPTTAPIEAAVPVEVALADEPPVPPPAARTHTPPVPPPAEPRAEGQAPPPAAAITAPGVPGVSGAGSASEIAPRQPPARSAMMMMRRGDVPRAELPGGRWDDLDHVPRGTAPEKDLTTGILHESGGGTHTSDQGVFVGKVNPDGTVKLTDQPNLHVHLALPTPTSLGRGLSSWYDSAKGRFDAEGDTAMAKQVQVTSGATAGPVDPVTTRNQDRATTVVVPIVAGGFDATDWLMRRHGQDPYASKKLAFLDQTRDERVQIGNRYRAAQLARSPQRMQKNLDALWAKTQDPAARKRALFELWDECAEAGDPSLAAGGQVARRLVIGFIRARLPAGSADAFTPAEIAAFARAQQSKATFQPYE
jgi:hypothetical protein